MPLKLSRVDSLGKGTAATGATLLGPKVRKGAGSCLLPSCVGAAKQVVPKP